VRVARSIIALGVALAAACSGPKFTAKDCDEVDCDPPSSGGSSNSGGTNSGEGGDAAAGTSAGGTATGGSSSGGSSTGGSAAGGVASGGITSGGSNTGGFSATSGSAGAGTAGIGGSGVPTFPAYGILDAFDREGPELGLDWTGGTTSYELTEQALTCTTDYCEGMFWSEDFGVAQEVFATLSSFSNRSQEINLVLKAQGDTNCDLIELFYSPILEQLSVAACWEDVDPWHTLGIVDIAFAPGDELGGRVGTDGFIDLFRNRIQVGRFDANDYPFIDQGGHIGVSGIIAANAEPNVWDDFGGGGR
jgi:hypothetical protein